MMLCLLSLLGTTMMYGLICVTVGRRWRCSCDPLSVVAVESRLDSCREAVHVVLTSHALPGVLGLRGTCVVGPFTLMVVSGWTHWEEVAADCWRVLVLGRMLPGGWRR